MNESLRMRGFWDYFACYSTRYFLGLRCPWFQLDIATGWMWDEPNCRRQWRGVRLSWGHWKGWRCPEGCYAFSHRDKSLCQWRTFE